MLAASAAEMAMIVRLTEVAGMFLVSFWRPLLAASAQFLS
jgi:hypothetical protein